MAELNTNIRGEQIRDNTIDESKLKVLNDPAEGYVLSWDSTSGQFEWSNLSSTQPVTEVPSGDINGSNTVFTITNSPVTGSLSVYLNGLYQEEGAGKDYQFDASTNTITFTDPPETGDILVVSYLKSTGAVVSGSSSYRTSFTNSDLSNGVLTVTHNLGQQYVLVQVYDNNDKMISPDEVTLVNSNSLQVDLSSFGTISGTWHVVVVS